MYRPMNTAMRYVIEGMKDYERKDAENAQLHDEVATLRNQLIEANVTIQSLKTLMHAAHD